MPIVALTANALAGDRECCLQSSMDDYLSKPVMLDELRVTIARWLTPPTVTPTPPSAQNLSETSTLLDHALLADLRSLQAAGMPDLLGGLIDLFIVEALVLMADIRSAIAAGDAAALRIAAHSFR